MMNNMILKGGLMVVMMSLMAACNQMKEKPPVMVDKEAIKTEIQAMENSFTEAYNNRSIDRINYYADDAVSFSNGKIPLEGKKKIHESMKTELTTFPKGAKIAFDTQEIHSSNDGDMVVEIGGYKVTDSTDTKINSGHFISLFEKRAENIFASEIWGIQICPCRKNKNNKERHS